MIISASNYLIKSIFFFATKMDVINFAIRNNFTSGTFIAPHERTRLLGNDPGVAKAVISLMPSRIWAAQARLGLDRTPFKL